MIIDKYNRIIVEKLPKNIATELEQIATDTDKFEDEELVEIYKDNFNDLFAIIEKKHPEALKPKAKLIKKASEKKKIVKKAEPFDEAVMSKIDPHDDWKGNLIKERHILTQISNQISGGSEKETENEVKRIFLLYADKFPGELSEQSKEFLSVKNKWVPKAKIIKKSPKKESKKSEPIEPTGKDIDLSMLVGKELEVYQLGVKDPEIKKITEAKVDDAKFDKRFVYIITGKMEYKFPLSKLDSFLEGKEIEPKNEGDAVVMNLKNASEIDCETAIAEVKAIHAKREAAAKKRADAPKKKVTTAAREKQIKTFTSVFKTKEFKADKKQAEGFAKDIVAVYNKYGLKSMAEQLEKDIQELIDTKYKKAEK